MPILGEKGLEPALIHDPKMRGEHLKGHCKFLVGGRSRPEPGSARPFYAMCRPPFTSSVWPVM